MKKIAYFLFYLLKTYFLSLLTMQSVIFVIAYINYAYFNLCVHEYNPILYGFLLGIVGSIFNFPLFMILYHYKFSNIEIISESILYVMITQIGGFLTFLFTGNIEDCHLLDGESPKISWFIVLFMVVVYLAAKGTIRNVISYKIKCTWFLVLAFNIFICFYIIKIFLWYNYKVAN